ncbi:hypothetical protein A4H97_09495 [Niastella yeongjuensis]|uniref:Uncharacterized protein n=1 Tax=Niastella yeongjuensis TaxID=354355 RepID=A0A1V9EEV1_9BACT|nr:hypothetical protein [Niastella yeongjuensis]OQP44592.1 hypothetical protein A4H97_09495 [Niastella yeongjuensis]SEO82122.1 hypothetical protein SAMN05660816_03644 [Niastella yeongjuensis]
MNYAKVLDAALTLFPKKIRVTCIDGVTGQQIGKYKIPLSQVPLAFNKPVTTTIDGHEWRIIKAEPVNPDDIAIFKKLTLHVLDKDQLSQTSFGYPVPTRHASIPLTTPTPFYQQFTIELSADDWLQQEFLPVQSLPLIQEELALIDPILLADNGFNPLLGYEHLHIRNQTALLGANIQFDAFCAALQVTQKGNIRLAGGDYIENGFALRTDNYEYYGTIENNQITHLSLTAFDCIDDEFSQVATSWGLALVNWCQGNITTV